MPRAIDIVRRVAPKARESYILAFQQGDALLKEHGITTPRRLAHFLAQVLHESGGLEIDWESGNYRAQRLLEIFGAKHSAKVRPAEASELAALAPLARKEEAIFERVYGLGNPKMAKDLGNEKPGDGFRYRGGGLLQTTGRDNYRRMGEKCGADFENHPEWVVSADHALKPALAEWSEHKLNDYADADDVLAISRAINLGNPKSSRTPNGMEDRRRWLARLKPLIKSVTFVDGAEPGTGPTPPPIVSDLAHRVVAAMESKGHHVDRGEGEVNIVYVEGMNPDGTLNADEANKWNDLRLLIRFEGGKPKIIGSWAATTEPGRYHTEHTKHPLGVARIEFGQYTAWQVGLHRGNHEALRQDGGAVTVCRDLNKDGERTGDKRDTGSFWINQHWGYDLAEVDKASAGCLVGQSKTGHREFMAIVKSDPRYQADHGHVFATAILPASEVLAAAPGKGEVIPVEPRDDVRRAQKLLGFSEEEQDGILGAITEEAIKSFQRRHGLPVTGDLDETTWDKLEPGRSRGAGALESGRGTGAGLLRRAREHIGEKYDHDLVPKDDPNWKGPFDCAEFMSWLVYQEAGILYGCTDDNAQPSQADAYTGGWQTDVGRRGIRVSVDKAAATVGGIVLRYPPPRGMGHIALCDGKGGTVEAKGKKYGVVADTVHGRGWHTGVLIPGINYDEPDPDIRPVKRPDVTYARNAPNMDRAIIIEIQKALASKGFSPGENDGEFGEVTEAAVVDFQESEGLVVDGEVGRDTADALGVSLKSPGSSSPDGPLKKIEKPFGPFGLGVGTMNPFIMIAARLLPGIIQAIAGDKAGTVAGAVTKAVTDITRAKNPEEAQDKLNADPDAYAALQLKLAEIANDYELARRKAELDLFKEQNKAEAERREAELKEFRAQLEDTKGARSTFSQLALANNPMAWGAPIVSFIVTLGFFGILVILMTVEAQFNPDNGQIINIAIGALAAGFATVISFWLGSSQGSRFKDVAASELQERQAQQNAAVLKQAEATMKTVIDKKSAAKAQKPPDQLRRCLDIVLWQEEGVSDRAGITKFGITLEELQSSRGKSVTEAELTTLTRQQACEIYRMRYWNIMRCDELPIGVDLVVFDLAADLSLSESARMLQQVVGAADDGAIGPVTMGAVDLATPRDIVTRMSELRREHKRNLADGSGKEGMSRITEVENAALRMIDAASAAAV